MGDLILVELVYYKRAEQALKSEAKASLSPPDGRSYYRS